MRLFPSNSLTPLAVFIVLSPAFVFAAVTESQNAAFPLTQKGVVVELLDENSEAQKAGLRPGDVLLRWNRASMGAEFRSPFDLPYIRFNETPRAKLAVEGFRAGHRRRWLLGNQPWGILGRPNFSSDLLLKYRKCGALPKAIPPEQAMQCWRTVIAETRGGALTFVEPWLLWQAARQFASHEHWDASDSAYHEALEKADANGPIVKGTLFFYWAYGLNRRGDLVNAVRRYEQAVSEWSKAEPESMAIAESLLELGAVFLNQGDFDKAGITWRRALAIGEKLAPSSMETSLAYDNLGAFYQQSGDLAKAEEYYQRSLAIQKRYFRGTTNIAHELANLGTLARERGDLGSAENYQRAALRAVRPARPQNFLLADILDDLSDCFLDRNDLASAEQYERRALSIRQKLVPNSLGVGSSFLNLGYIAERGGKLDEAERQYREALAVEERLGSESPVVADAIAGLGSVAQKRGDAAKAEEYIRKALAVLDKTVPASLKHGEMLASLAATVRLQQRLDEAAQLYRQGLNELESKTAQLGPFGENQSRYRGRHANYYREYVDLLVEQGRDQLAFETLEGSHARTLFAMLSVSHINIREGVDPALLARERNLRQALNGKSQYRFRLLNARNTLEQVDAIDQEIADLRQNYAQLEAEIQSNSPAYAALTQPRSLSAREIQQLLGPDTLLLEYSLGDDRSRVWAVSENSLASYELPRRVQIERSARQLYHLLTLPIHLSGDSNAPRSAGIRADADYQKAAAELSRMILSPVAHMLAGKRLLIVSDGALQYIPFSALPSPHNADLPLIVEHEIVDLPSASVLAELRRAREGRPAAQREVAVLADPVFEASDERVAGGSKQPNSKLRSWRKSVNPLAELNRSASDIGLSPGNGFYLDRLLYTRRESQAIMAVTPPGQAMLALDFRASRATAMNPELARYRIVHFATHGLLDSKRPELSGLVLSLVDRKGNPQDGFLGLADIYNLNLPVDLAVLSGCQTGLGEEISGEGLIGLTRGFMYAGASRVVASLWSVSDEATSEFMARFYKAMEQERMRPAAALRSAQIEMWKQKRWSQPYYWAAFQIQGDWK